MAWELRTWGVLVAVITLGACRTPSSVFLPKIDPADHTPPSARLTVTLALSEAAGNYRMDFTFRAPEKPAISVHFEVAKSSFDALGGIWGYRVNDLEKIDDNYESARRKALEAAQERGASQAEFDEELKGLRAVHQRTRRDYIVSKGFRFLPDGLIAADLPALVRANTARLAPLTKAIAQAGAAAGRPKSWVVPAAAALVQTALEYGEVPAVVDGVHTGGVWPPVTTLVYGWGDCDTKAALLAAMLADLPGTRIIGIEMSNHYLLGIAMNPAKDEAYILFQGRKYVFFEPSGPIRLGLGEIGDETKRFFRRGHAYTVEPLY